MVLIIVGLETLGSSCPSVESNRKDAVCSTLTIRLKNVELPIISAKAWNETRRIGLVDRLTIMMRNRLAALNRLHLSQMIGLPLAIATSLDVLSSAPKPCRT
ncbi:hypothetical protein ACHAW5_009641 [Stephanodiscus triporus]|uniref:Uncharacterized protein n=1 Tax=Stephanodiscus triporus TaxID=2934178 RepID=A0ABD3QFX9_9STRA